MDCGPLGSSNHGISQVRRLECVVISFSRGSSQPRHQTRIYYTGRQILHHWATREAPPTGYPNWKPESSWFLLFFWATCTWMNRTRVSYTAREAQGLSPLICPAAFRTWPPFPSSGRRASPPPPLLLQELSPTQWFGDPVRGEIRTGPCPGFPNTQAQSPGRHPAEPEPLHLLLSLWIVSDPPGQAWPSSGSASCSSAWTGLPPDPCLAAFLSTSHLPCPTDQKKLSQRRQALLHFSVMLSSIQMIFRLNSSWAISNPERWCCESAALNMSAKLEKSAVDMGLEKVSFHSNSKGNAKECSNYRTIALISHASKVMLKILQASLQKVHEPWTMNFQRSRLDLENAEEPEIKLATSVGL